MILAGYTFCYASNRERRYLLMAGLYVVYLLSELLRILFFLSSPHSYPYPQGAAIASEWLMEAFYFLIILEQLKKPLAKPEAGLLCVITAALCSMSFFTPTEPISQRLSFYVFLWGSFRLFPLRNRDRRTKGLFWTAFIVSLYPIVFNITSLFLPIKTMLHYSSSFALTSFYHEIRFYIIIAASILDLISGFPMARPAPGPAQEPPGQPPPFPVERVADEYGLSNREKEVFELLVQGKSNAEISRLLFISEGTVKVHIHNIYQKLGITNRRQINQILLERV